MTTTSMDATAGTPTSWVLRRSDPGGDDILPGEDTAAGETGLGFGDLLDVINPLQHLPIVGTIYRALTGDTISETARVAGGALYGGPFGVVGALANLVMEHETGKDIGDTAMAWLTDGPTTGADSGTTVAAAPPEPQPSLDQQPPVVLASYTPAAAPPVAAAAPRHAPGSLSSTTVLAAADKPGTTQFEGRSASRLDDFIRNANSVKRSGPAPGSLVDTTRMQTAALQAPTVSGKPKDRAHDADARAEPSVALAGGDAGSVNEWMLRALDKYEHMQKQESS